MAHILTLEQAIKNEQTLHREYLQLKKRYSSSKKPKDFVAMRKVEAELEWYNGYVEYEVKRDAYGKPIQDNNGNFIRTRKIKTRVAGAIQVLSGQAHQLLEESNLGERFMNRTFDNFDSELNKRAFERAKAYANKPNLFSETDNSRIFIGEVGTGKTHLAASIANLLISKGIPVLFATCNEHLMRIKSQFDSDNDGEYLARMKNTPMLMIDDLGKEQRTEWSIATLFDVINYRYEHLLPLVITTNINEADLQDYLGTAIASRLLETGRVIKTIGEDYRSIK